MSSFTSRLGQSDSRLGAFQLGSISTPEITGSPSLGAVTCSGSGVLIITGTGACTLAAVVCAGKEENLLSGAISLSPVACAGQGQAGAQGTAAIALSPVQCVGVLSDPNPVLLAFRPMQMWGGGV